MGLVEQGPRTKRERAVRESETISKRRSLLLALAIGSISLGTGLVAAPLLYGTSSTILANTFLALGGLSVVVGSIAGYYGSSID